MTNLIAMKGQKSLLEGSEYDPKNLIPFCLCVKRIIETIVFDSKYVKHSSHHFTAKNHSLWH